MKKLETLEEINEFSELYLRAIYDSESGDLAKENTIIIQWKIMKPTYFMEKNGMNRVYKIDNETYLMENLRETFKGHFTIYKKVL